VALDDLVESPQNLRNGSVDFLLILDCIGKVGAVETDELDEVPRNDGSRVLTHDQDADDRRHSSAIDEPDRLELILDRSSILQEHLGCDRVRQIPAFEQIEVEIVERRRGQGLEIEGEIGSSPVFGQADLLLPSGGSQSGPSAYPSSTAEPRGWGVARLYGEHDHLAIVQESLLHRHGGEGLDLSLASQVRDLAQPLVRDLEASAPAVVMDSDEHHAGTTVAGEIVGERTDRLPDVRALGQGSLALHPIRLEVAEKGFELVVGEPHAPSCRRSHRRDLTWYLATTRNRLPGATGRCRANDPTESDPARAGWPAQGRLRACE
jgi:hypothetical protein